MTRRPRSWPRRALALLPLMPWCGAAVLWCGAGVSISAQDTLQDTLAQDTDRPIPAHDLLLRVTVASEQVELGKAFPLTVLRVWSKQLAPADWSDDALAPLVVRLVDTARREDDRRVEETRRYACYAFQRGEVTVPAPRLEARPVVGGEPRVVLGDVLHLRVRSALPAGQPGPVELPREPFPAPSRWPRWPVVGAVTLALALAAWSWHARRRARRDIPAAPPVAAHVRALDGLERLRGLRPHGAEETRAYYVEASGLVRSYIEERFSVRALEMTTEEFLADPETARVLRHGQRDALSEFLARCDLAKFARHAPADAERERLLEAAATFVGQTRDGRAVGHAGDPGDADDAGTPRGDQRPPTDSRSI